MADREFASEPLPESPRVVYEKNPLIEVLCQLRFPAILRIPAEPPAAFQEQIRSLYPLLTEKQPEALDLPPGVPPHVAEAFRSLLPRTTIHSYEFGTADEEWKVTLSRDSLALTASAYRRWEDFREHLGGPLQALSTVYAPSFVNRVGLRYRNLIRRSNLGLPAGTKWSELVKGHIAGVLTVPELEAEIAEIDGQFAIKLPQFNAKVRVQYGLVLPLDTNEDCFLIDSDFYTEERSEIKNVDNILAYFNRQSGRLFRWCIQDRLHAAMEPEPVAPME